VNVHTRTRHDPLGSESSARVDFMTILTCDSTAAVKIVPSERSAIYFSLLIDGALSWLIMRA